YDNNTNNNYSTDSFSRRGRNYHQNSLFFRHRDMIKRVCLKNLVASRIKVEEIMSSPLITIMSYDSIDTASRVMSKNKIKRLVVLEPDNRITGLLSVFDITKHLAKILLDDYNRYRSLRFAVNLS